MTPDRRPRLDLDRLEGRTAPAGDLDLTFGTGGSVLFPPGDLGGVAGVAVQPDGWIVLSEAPAPSHDPVDVIRLTSNGMPDSTFGTGGRTVIDFGGPVGGGGVAVLPGGSVLVGSGVQGGISVARLTPAGALDTAFGGGGRATVVAPDWGLIVRALLVQPDGRIVLAGEAFVNGQSSIEVRRLTAEGSPDPTFGDGGRARFPIGDNASARAAAVLPDGGLLLAGSGTPPGSFAARLTALRLTPAGVPDPAFGTGGRADVDFDGESPDGALAMAVQPDGRIVLAGHARRPFPSEQGLDFAVARLTPDGALDPTFGTGGRVWVDAGGDERASGLLVQADGGIVITGSSTADEFPPPSNLSDLVAARLTADGQPDARFGTNGVTRADNGESESAGAAVVQPDGRVVLAGSAGRGFAVVRFTADPPAAAPGTVLAGGAGGYAALLNPAAGGYVPAGAVELHPGSLGPVRVAAADVTGDGVPDLVGGTGPGTVPMVAVLDGKTAAPVATLQPFEDRFTGGVYVAAADLTGDGKADLVVSPDRGGGPVVVVYDGANLTAESPAEVIRYFGIEDAEFRGGARPAVGDLTGDGTVDVVVAAGFLGGPRVTIWDGQAVLAGRPAAVANFFAFEDTLRNGTFVAVGDVTGDGRADLAFGGGPGGGPRVRLFNGKELLAADPFDRLDDRPAAERANFFAGDAALRGGVRLALRDADGDGKADLTTGSGDGEPPRVRVYLAPTLLANPVPFPDQEFDPFGSVLADGVFVG